MVLRLHDDFHLSHLRWIALLSIVHRYEFLNVWKRAIREIYDRELIEGTMDPSDREPSCTMLISVAEEFDVPHQHVERYIVMRATQAEPLTEDEAALLSTATMCRLARAREEFLHKTLPSRGQVVSMNYLGDMAKEIVSNIWRIAKKCDG